MCGEASAPVVLSSMEKTWIDTLWSNNASHTKFAQNIMLVLNKFFRAIQLVIVYDLYLFCNLDFSTVARFLVLKC